MAIIRFHTKQPEDISFNTETIKYDGTVIGWILENIKQGENFSVYSGGISKSNEISRDADKIKTADNVDVFILPAGATTAFIFIASVILVTALIPKIGALPNVNRQQQSPNNALSNRNNKPRPNERIVDICGKVKSIPDVIQQEFAQFNKNTEERIGYYCIARNQVQVEDIKDGDSFIKDIVDASAGVYYPNKSPNNSAPDIQIGEAINERVKGVFQSSDAIGQTLESPNSSTLTLNSTIEAFQEGYFQDLTGEFIFTDYFEAGDTVQIINAYIYNGEDYLPIGLYTNTVLSVTDSRITFDISGDTTWAQIPLSGADLQGRNDPTLLTNAKNKVIGPFDITSQKVDELLVNVYAPNGMYKENSKGKARATVEYNVIYQKLDDNGEPIGAETTVLSEISGLDSNERGVTTKIDLGAETYVRWSLRRITDTDFEFDGQIVDEIKIKDVFGRWELGVTDFGNVTTIQTKRTSVSQAAAIRNPELNCIATELIYKYLGNGVFDTELTPNTQAMQSLIRLALDPYIGRREESELDLDGLLALQEENETYFQSLSGGQFNYSFDSTTLSAQETFFSIARAAFITLWREGRVLKGWFEKPQSIPSMVFTHRSKQPNSEAWKRDLNGTTKKDSIEFVYTDDEKYTQETLYFPADRSGKNPLREEYTGVKGLEQATWHMMRRYNKLLYQEVTVDFGATQEGRFVRPKRMISVVKGSRTDTYDGEILAVNGLFYTLSQDVYFTENDDHYIILKNRDGSTESLLVTGTDNPRVVQLLQIPSQEPYTGNSELRTEFSLGNEARLLGQLMMPESITPSDRDYVKIKAINYSDLYYKDDAEQPILGGFSNGFSNGFN